MKQLTIREAADFLLRNDNYVLLTHRRPDGDTIGSAAALCAGLRLSLIHIYLELLQKGGYYHDLYTRQFAEESAARILK